MSPIETHVDFIYVFLHISLGIWFVLIIHCSWVIAGDAAHRLAHCPAQYEARATKCGQVSLPQTILCLPLRFHFCLNFFFCFFCCYCCKNLLLGKLKSKVWRPRSAHAGHIQYKRRGRGSDRRAEPASMTKLLVRRMNVRTAEPCYTRCRSANANERATEWRVTQSSL